MFMPAADANLVENLGGKTLDKIDKIEDEFIKIDNKITQAAKTQAILYKNSKS